MSKQNSFKKILIANRGEIACRIERTLDRMGVTSIAIFSDPDRHALHVKGAKESWPLDGSESKDTYLDIKKIIKIAKESGADAVHPGYGFLSENPEFATALKKAGIQFIGPSAKVINLMGDKIAAKELANSLKIPVIKGYSFPLSKELPLDSIIKFGKQVGYPLVIKAAAGGGGRGMRVVGRAQDLQSLIESASREAKASFNNGTVFIEKYLVRCRHIEIQIFADDFGNVTTICDRDCTLQRNHQKIIEEAPAPNLTSKIRAAMHDAARALAKKSGYTNAGTVEFLLSPDNKFYFLEVNSRLQVEHPVTEAVTGIDLVEAQVKIAEGQKLDKVLSKEFLTKTPFEPKSAAIELRICAEVPELGFAPSTGTIERCEFPIGQHLRVDTGFVAGDVLSHYYDSLVGKVIISADTRFNAIVAAQHAVSALRIGGIQTNIGFLAHLIKSQEFSNVKHDTTFASATNTQSISNDKISVALGGVFLLIQNRLSSENTFGNFRIHGRPLLESSYKIFGVSQRVRVQKLSDVRYEICTATKPNTRIILDRFAWLGCSGCTFEIGKNAITVNECEFGPNSGWIYTSIGTFEVTQAEIPLKSRAVTTQHFGSDVISPLPGKIISVKINKGDHVEIGTPLIILESMKMEHTIKAASVAKIAEVLVQSGSTVGAGSILLRYA